MAAENEFGATTFATPSDREVVITRVVDAPRRLVWDAWTKPEHLPHWMLGPSAWTMPVCEIDLRPGGSWHFVWRSADGTRTERRAWEGGRPGEPAVVPFLTLWYGACDLAEACGAKVPDVGLPAASTASTNPSSCSSAAVMGRAIAGSFSAATP